MAMNTYGGAAAGNPTNAYALGQMLKSADAVEVVDRFVKTVPVPKNKNETISLQRRVTPDPSVSEVSEGINPVSRSLTYENVTKTFQEFAEVFTVSSRQAELGEYPVLMDSKDRLIDLMKRIREKNAWFTYRACNNVVYNSSAHTARNQVNGAISLGRIRVAVRTLINNRASVIRQMTKGSVNINTTPVEPAFISFSHTDTQPDIRNITGFRPTPQIGGLTDGIPQLFGYVENVCFITSPEFEPFYAAGAAVGATGMRSAGGVNVDVYTYLLFGAEALGKASLAGTEKGLGAVEMNVLDKADKSDPTNQRRMVSCRWWDAPVILNQNWVVTVECGVTENPA